MNSVSQLAVVGEQVSTAPIYLNKAAMISDDPVERMRLCIAHTISAIHHNKIFEKPLNPILGETYQSVSEDGTRQYLEQTSHHPPTSHYLIEGANGGYTCDGYMELAVHSGMTSATINMKGFKRVVFKDG